MDDTGRSSGISSSHDRVVLARIDRMAGPTGRRRWPVEVKGRLVAESYRTELSISEFARRQGLIPAQLFTWRRDAKVGKLAVPVEEGEGFFAPLLVGDAVDTPAPHVRAGMVELQAGRVVIRLAADTPAARIAEIARALA